MLRKAPLILDSTILTSPLSVLDYIPLRSLREVAHFHFLIDGKGTAVAVWYLFMSPRLGYTEHGDAIYDDKVFSGFLKSRHGTHFRRLSFELPGKMAMALDFGETGPTLVTYAFDEFFQMMLMNKQRGPMAAALEQSSTKSFIGDLDSFLQKHGTPCASYRL